MTERYYVLHGIEKPKNLLNQIVFLSIPPINYAIQIENMELCVAKFGFGYCCDIFNGCAAFLIDAVLI